MNYPNDANDETLRRMRAQGDNLSRPRNIDFTIVFPDEHSAGQFAKHFQALGYTTSVHFMGTGRDLPWDVIVVKHMVPLHGEIGNFESLLENIAEPYGGYNDGWGCFSEPY